MRIILERVCRLFDRILSCFSVHDRIPLLLCKFNRHVRIAYFAHNTLINALPVINILSFAPYLLEGSLTLLNRCWVIEIPRISLLLSII